MFKLILSLMIIVLGATAQAAKRSVAAVPRTVIAYQEESGLSPELVTAYHRFSSEESAAVSVIRFPNSGETSAEQMLGSIADQTLLSFWNSDSFKHSSFGRTAAEVESTMTTQMALGEKKEHKINFQLMAFENLAKVEYEGYAKAVVYYQAKSSEVGIQFSKKITQDKDLILSHQLMPIATVSQVNLKWNW